MRPISRRPALATRIARVALRARGARSRPRRHGRVCAWRARRARKADGSPVTARRRARRGDHPGAAERARARDADRRRGGGRRRRADSTSAPRFFLVDPLDGTKEFISRNGEFTINIALIEPARRSPARSTRPRWTGCGSRAATRLCLRGAGRRRPAAAAAWRKIADPRRRPPASIALASRSHGDPADRSVSRPACRSPSASRRALR